MNSARLFVPNNEPLLARLGLEVKNARTVCIAKHSDVSNDFDISLI